MEPTLPPVPPERPDLGGLLDRLSGVFDLGVLATRAATEVQRLLTRHLICVTWVDPSAPRKADDTAPPLVVAAERGHRHRELAGLRLAPGDGIGGLTASRGALVSVEDYTTGPVTQDLIGIMVEREGVGGAAGLPLFAGERLVGILFAGNRDRHALPDRELDLLVEVAGYLGTLAGTASKAQRMIELARTEERQRVASQLHDDVTQLLFAVGASAHRAREVLGAEQSRIRRELEQIESLASSAASATRSALRAMAPVPPEHRLPQALRTAVGDVAERAGLTAEFTVLDPVPEQPAPVARLLVAVAREALANVARHAPGASALVSLVRDDREVSLLVQDDGPGLPAGFALQSITGADVGEHFGLASLAHRADLLGGRLSVADNEDGGVTVRVAVPVEADR